MDLYHLRHVPWIDSQLIYHAQLRLGVEGINILAPAEPYVCIGYHQDLAQEVDVEYCQAQGIPVFRREVGGGAVFLDGKQIFYQIVMHKDHPLAQGSKESFYRRMLQPVAQAYTDLGVPSLYRPVNDVITAEGRKIAGTGAATVGDYVVLVGNLIADFDYQTMARVLRVPDEKYRDKVFNSIQENLTTLKRETGREMAWDEMVEPLIKRFEQVLGPLQNTTLPQEVYNKAIAIKPQFMSAEWLYKKGRRLSGRDVKIATGVNVVQRIHKAPGGLIRTTMELKDGRLGTVSLSGDFFCYPMEAIAKLETSLEGVALGQIGDALGMFYANQEIETPGVTIDDWLKVLGG